MAITLPAVNFDKTKLIYATCVRGVFTPTTGSAIQFIAKKCDWKYNSSTTERRVPGEDGMLRADTENGKEAGESYTFVDIEEVESILTAMQGASVKPKKGTIVIWVSDQDDEVGTRVKAKSESFPCSLKVEDGTTSFGGGEHSKISLTVKSLYNREVRFALNATS